MSFIVELVLISILDALVVAGLAALFWILLRLDRRFAAHTSSAAP